MYFGKPGDTSTFGNKIAALFFAILICVFSAIAEVNALWEQRPIVEKHKSYAFYHPATEAIAGIVIDLLPKFLLAVAFNLVIYFLSQLRAQPGPFFLYFLITYMATFTMAALFRSIAALTGTISEAMTYSGVSDTRSQVIDMTETSKQNSTLLCILPGTTMRRHWLIFALSTFRFCCLPSAYTLAS